MKIHPLIYFSGFTKFVLFRNYWTFISIFFFFRISMNQIHFLFSFLIKFTQNISFVSFSMLMEVLSPKGDNIGN